jgi:hypothetical protein
MTKTIVKKATFSPEICSPDLADVIEKILTSGQHKFPDFHNLELVKVALQLFK